MRPHDICVHPAYLLITASKSANQIGAGGFSLFCAHYASDVNSSETVPIYPI